jgi:KaiC/GvpD/RAD55 family RecA-like ATPase
MMTLDAHSLKATFVQRHGRQLKQAAEKWTDNRDDPLITEDRRSMIDLFLAPTVEEAIHTGFSDHDIAREVYRLHKHAGYPIGAETAVKNVAQYRARLCAGRPMLDEFDEMTGVFSHASYSLRKQLQTVSEWSIDSAFLFGIPNVDELIGGVQPGEMMAISGAQGSMKTSFLLSGIENALVRGMTVLFYSLDMTPSEIQERRIQRRLRCHQYVLHGLIRENSADVYRAIDEINDIDDGRFHILGNDGPNPDVKIDDIQEMAAHVMPNVLCVDYLTLLRREIQSDLECVNEVMGKFKRLAQSFGIRVVLLSQMGRASKREQFSGVMGGHAKGGGAIEEMVHSEVELFKDVPGDTGAVPIIATITKNRRGPSGRSYRLGYEPKCMFFTGESVRVERVGRAAQKRAFDETPTISADDTASLAFAYKDGE